MNRSENLNELAAALAKAQASIRGAAKDKANPFFKSRYADLASVWEACRKPLTDNGLSVVQLPALTEAGVTVTTILLHASGQWISGDLASPLKEHTPQAIGSVTTYIRRYALSAIAGVAPDDDDDAEAGMGRKPGNGHAAPPPQDSAAFDNFTKAIDLAADIPSLALIQKQVKKSCDEGKISDEHRATLRVQFSEKLKKLGELADQPAN